MHLIGTRANFHCVLLKVTLCRITGTQAGQQVFGSLSLFAVVLELKDGFNICAVGVLNCQKRLMAEVTLGDVVMCNVQQIGRKTVEEKKTHVQLSAPTLNGNRYGHSIPSPTQESLQLYLPSMTPHIIHRY